MAAGTATAHIYECKSRATRWDYWWYGTGSVYRCVDSNVCHLSHVDTRTIGWSVTEGLSVTFNVAKDAAYAFQASYTFSESITTGDTYTVDYHPPITERLWVKQWFAVTNMDCQQCDWVCSPIGGADPANSSLEPPGQHCEKACDPYQHTVTWVPCRDANCLEYQFSDAFAQCDNSNHCQLN
ncbi:hypothetical protein VFPPC_02795 [Pochonia chlamydosporia 170]|uniref:Uncharacterized protein n=1 Tax=Pochonia chlamydosporia 170 TaxID=1380566 RepID=A0A179FXE1_METCM|nr:hypothetical protein VFPPC_02795 [Pochonia chlamydosporia 170]OAQ70304.2 hypothetical protein VFPPC_02795 [Pochonia chlamydosporia 170]